MADLTLAAIIAAEKSFADIRAKLQAIGRVLYEMREGDPLGSEYRFEDYSRQIFESSNHYGQEGPNWSKGTPIFSLWYYWPRGENVITVTFPQEWIAQDWRALEANRLAVAQWHEQAAREDAARKLAERHVIAERETYERLRAKFEGTAK